MLDLMTDCRLDARRAQAEKRAKEENAKREVAKAVSKQNAEEIRKLRAAPAYRWLAKRLAK